MSCSSWEESIALHVEGDLPPAETRELEDHLANCATCRAFAAEMNASQAAWKQAALEAPLGEVVLAEIRANVQRELSAPVRPRPAWRGARRWLALAAGIVLAVALWRVQGTDSPTRITAPENPASENPAPENPAPKSPAPEITVPPIPPGPTAVERAEPTPRPKPFEQSKPLEQPKPTVALPSAAAVATRPRTLWIDDQPLPGEKTRWLPPTQDKEPTQVLKLNPNDKVVIYWLAEPAENTKETNNERTRYL